MRRAVRCLALVSIAAVACAERRSQPLNPRATLSDCTLVVFSPDSRFFVTRSKDGPFTLRNSSDGGPRVTIDVGHTEQEDRQPEFSADGKWLAVGGDDNAVHVWEVEAGRERLKVPAVAWTNPFAFAPDGRSIAVVLGEHINPRRVEVWDLAAGRARFAVEAGCLGVAFSPDGKTLATADASGNQPSVRLWDAATGAAAGEPIASGIQVRTHGLAFSADGKLLAAVRQPVSSERPVVEVFDIAGRKRLAGIDGRQSGHYTGGRRLEFRNRDRWLFAGDDSAGRIYARPDQGILIDLQVTPPKILELVVRLDRSECVVLGDRRARVVRDAANKTASVELTPWGDDAAPTRLLGPVPAPDELNLPFVLAGRSADGKRLAVLYKRPDRTRLVVFDTTRGRQVAEVPDAGADVPMTTAVFSPDSRTLATILSGTVRLWELPPPD
jgi:WD40 repeat protein